MIHRVAVCGGYCAVEGYGGKRVPFVDLDKATAAGWRTISDILFSPYFGQKVWLCPECVKRYIEEQRIQRLRRLEDLDTEYRLERLRIEEVYQKVQDSLQ